eukprot:9490575-Pyramimonas_sp.AAC.1
MAPKGAPGSNIGGSLGPHLEPLWARARPTQGARRGGPLGGPHRSLLGPEDGPKRPPMGTVFSFWEKH